MNIISHNASNTIETIIRDQQRLYTIRGVTKAK